MLMRAETAISDLPLYRFCIDWLLGSKYAQLSGAVSESLKEQLHHLNAR